MNWELKNRLSGYAGRIKNNETVKLLRKIIASKRVWAIRKGKWIRKHAFLSALFYTLFFLACLMFFGQISWDGPDDFTVSMLLSGAFGTSSPLNPISNFFLNIILIPLYRWIPAVNWFGALELLSVLFSFLALNYIFIKNAEKRGLRYALLLSPIFETESFLKLQYTRSALLLTFAGTLLIFDTFLRSRTSVKKSQDSSVRILKRHWGLYLAGIIMIVFGSWFRFSCLYLGGLFGLLFVFCEAANYLIRNRGKKQLRQIITKSVALFCVYLISFSVCYATKAANDSICNHNEEYMAYVEYNLERANTVDYLPNYYYDLNSEGLTVSENDFRLLKNGIIYDDYFSLDYWKSVKDKLSIQNISDKKIFFSQMTSNLLRYNQGKYKGRRTLLLLCLFMSFIALFLINKRNVIHYICFVSVTLAVSFYFSSTGRYPPWVADPVYYMCCACLLLSLAKYPMRVSRRSAGVRSVLALVLLLGCVGYSAVRTDKHIKAHTHNASLENILDYAAGDKDSIYLIDSTNNMPYPVINLYGPCGSISRGEWSNIIRVGNWDVKHPVKNAQLKELQIDSPVSSLLEDNVYLITSTNGMSDITKDMKSTSDTLMKIAERFARASESTETNASSDKDADSFDYQSLADAFFELSDAFVTLSAICDEIPLDTMNPYLDDLVKYQTFFEEHYNVAGLNCEIVYESGEWCIVKLHAASNDEPVQANNADG